MAWCPRGRRGPLWGAIQSREARGPYGPYLHGGRPQVNSSDFTGDLLVIFWDDLLDWHFIILIIFHVVIPNACFFFFEIPPSEELLD